MLAERVDAVSGRWFVSIFASQTNSAAVLLAVSTTSDPTQLFGFNAFYPPTPLVNFPDQPRFGLNDDKVILGATAYDCQSSGCPTPTDPYNGAFEGAEYFIRVSGI